MKIQLKAGTGYRMKLKKKNKKNRNDFKLGLTVFYVFYFVCFSSLKIFSFPLTVIFINFVSLSLSVLISNKVPMLFEFAIS